MKHKKILIIGATALACGIASVYGSDCLVVGLDSSAGSEFADAMDNHPVDFTKLGAAGRELCDELEARGVLNERGELHILALAGVFAKRFLDSGCDILLGAVPVSIEQTGDGFLATIFTAADGYIQVQADHVIDTTVQPDECRKIGEGIKKTFGMMLSGETSYGGIDGAKLTKGYFDDEYVLRFEIPENSSDDMSIPDAQKLADEWLEKNSGALGRAKVVSIALAFGYESAGEIFYIKDGIKHIPSGAVSDAVTAFDRGASIAL